MAELARVPEDVVRAFSTRRQQILSHLAETGASGWRAGQVAAIATREGKAPVDLEELGRDWQARAAEHGFGPRELSALLREGHRWQTPTRTDCHRIAGQLVAADGLTVHASAFTTPDAVKAWCAALPDGAPAERILATVEDFTRLDGVTLVAESPGAGMPRRFSTEDLVAVERSALQLALGEVGDGRLALDPTIVARRLETKHAGLRDDQAEMVRRVAATHDRVVCVVGPAGSGKTTALRALHDVYRQAGVALVGAAPSGIAAESLTDASGIPSRTLHRLLGVDSSPQLTDLSLDRK